MIILDTNVLPRNGSLGGPTLALVRAIAQKTGHDVALPAIVVEESVADLNRNLAAEWQKAKVASEGLARFFPGFRFDRPDLSKRVERWRVDLTQSFIILDPPPDAANEALRREAHRIAPTRAGGEKGSGARDALIWLTALEAYRRESADSALYFVTNDSRAFGRDKLLHSLQQEVDAVVTAASFHYLNSMTDLLEELAVPAGPGPTKDDLLASEQVTETVEAAVRYIDTIGYDYSRLRDERELVWAPAGRLVLRVSLRSAEAATAYQVGGQRFAAVSTVWDGVAVISGYVGAETGSGGVSKEYMHHYAARLLLLVELEDDGRVKAADVAAAEPFVYDRTDSRTIG